MMTATALAEYLEVRHAKIVTKGDKISVTAPRSTLTPQVKAEINRHKLALIAMVNPPDTAGPSTWARRASALLSGICHAGVRADLRMRFEERAAICEFDGGMKRNAAEKIAYKELRMAAKIG